MKLPEVATVFALFMAAGCHDKADKSKAAGASSAAAPFAECSGPQAAPKPGSAPTISGQIYTDITPTMQGFAGGVGSSTSLRQVHNHLEVAVSEATSPGPRRCSLGAKWVCAKYQEPELRKCVSWGTTPAVVCASRPADYGAAATYAAVTETSKLDDVLVRRPVPEKVDPDHPAPVDHLDEARLTVIVSSGIEPGALTTGAGVTAAQACAAGSNPACVASALVERAKEGFGVWAVTVALPFQGTYVADVPVDAKFLGATKGHLESLDKVAAGQTTPFVGVDFNATSQTAFNARGASSSKYTYEGLRPLLVIALSRDHTAGRAFVKAFTEKLRADPALRPGKMVFEDVVGAVELSPLAADSYALAPLELAPKGPAGQGDTPPGALAEFHVSAPGASVGGSWADVSCGANGKAWLLAHYKATPPLIPLPGYIKQTVWLDGPSSNEVLPPKTSVSQRNGEDPAFRIFASCGPLAARPEAWAVEYLMRAKSEVDPSALGTAWFARVSAPNAYEMPERVYGLSEVFGAVLRQAVNKEYCAQKVRINIRRGT